MPDLQTGTYLDDLPPDQKPAMPPAWEDVKDTFTQAYPDLDPSGLQKAYEHAAKMHVARQQVEATPEPWAQSFIGRRSIPFASSGVALKEASDYGDAARRMHAGTQAPADYETVARYEQRQQQDIAQGRTWGGGIAQAAAHIPAIAGEALVGGRLLGAAAEALPESAAPWLAAPAATPSVKLPSLLSTEGLAAAARGSPQYATRTLAQTATMPSMYAGQWTQNNLEAGRPALHPAGLPAAYGAGVAQVAVLGTLGRLGLEAPGTGLTGLANRSMLRGAGGVLEQQAVDLGTSAISEAMPEWLKTKTRYGLLGELLDPKQRDDVVRHGTIQALTFAAFGFLHERPANVIGSYGRALDTEAVKGVPLRQAVAHVGAVTDAFAQQVVANPHLTPEEARQEAMKWPEGPLRDHALALATTLTEHLPAQGPEPGQDTVPQPQAAPPAAPNRPPVPGAQSPTVTAPRRAQSLYDSMVDTFGHDDTLARVRRLVPELAPDWQPQQSRDAAALYQELRRKGMSDKAASAAVQTAYPVQSGGKAAPGPEAVLRAGSPPEETEGAAVPPESEHLPAQGPSPGLEKVPPGESDDSPEPAPPAAPAAAEETEETPAQYRQRLAQTIRGKGLNPATVEEEVKTSEADSAMDWDDYAGRRQVPWRTNSTMMRYARELAEEKGRRIEARLGSTPYEALPTDVRDQVEEHIASRFGADPAQELKNKGWARQTARVLFLDGEMQHEADPRVPDGRATVTDWIKLAQQAKPTPKEEWTPIRDRATRLIETLRPDLVNDPHMLEFLDDVTDGEVARLAKRYGVEPASIRRALAERVQKTPAADETDAAGQGPVAAAPARPAPAAAPAVPETSGDVVGEGLTAARLRSVASSEWERPVVDDFLNQPLGEDPLLGETHADLLRRLWQRKGLPLAQVEAFIAARQHEARAREESRRQDPLRALEASGSGRNYFKPGFVTPTHEERLQRAVAAGVVATGEDANGRWYQRTGDITGFLNAESSASPGTARTPAVPETPGDVVGPLPGESSDSPGMPSLELARRGRVESQQADLFKEADQEGISRDDLHRHAQEIREQDKQGVADDKQLLDHAWSVLAQRGVSRQKVQRAEDAASVPGLDDVLEHVLGTERYRDTDELFEALKSQRQVLTEKQAYRRALDNLLDQKLAAKPTAEDVDEINRALKSAGVAPAPGEAVARAESEALEEGSQTQGAAPASSPAGPAVPGAEGAAAATGGAGAAEVGDAAGGGTGGPDAGAGGRAAAELEASRQALVRYGFPPGDLAREEREALGMIQSLRPGEGWSHSLQNVIDSYEDGTDEANPEIGNEQQMMRDHLRKLIAVVNPAALGPKPAKGHSPSTAPPEQGDAAGGGDTDTSFDVASFGAAAGQRGGGVAPPPGTPGARAGGAPAAAPAGAWYRAVGRWLRSAAQQVFPATTDLARESGEKMARAAAARDAGIAEWRDRAKDLGVDQLERPEALADNMLIGTTLLEFRARFARNAWQKETVRQSALAAKARAAGDQRGAQTAALAATEAMRQAQAIVVFVGQPGSPLPTEAKYQQSIQDIKPLIEKMVQKWTPVVDAQLRNLKGIDPMDAIDSRTQIPGLPISAIALPPDTPDGPGIVRIGRSGGGTSGMQGLLIRRPGFTRAAGLDAPAYDVRLTEMLKQRLLTGVEGVARAEAVRQLLADGILKDQGKGDAVPPGFKYLGLDPNKGIAGIDPNAKYFVHPEAYREVMNGLGIGQRAAETMLGEALPAVQGFNDKLYNLALMSPVELTRHTYNHLRALFKPGMGFPLWNLYKSIGNFKKVWDQDPDMMGRVADLAKIGASFEHQARPGILGEGLADRDPTAWVNHWTSKFIDTMQKAVRVQLDDAWGRIVKVPGGPEDTETGRRDFINQALGNYNARSSNGVLQFLKDTGLQGFATASWTGTIQGIRALGGGLNMKPTTLEGQIKFRAIAYAKMLPLLALGPVTNYLLYGEAFPAGVPPFAIKTRDKEDGRVGYVDPVEITGLRRGMRATGLEAGAEDIAERVSGRPGQEMGAVSQQGIHQMLGAGAGMLEGPPVQALHTAITGENFSGHRVAPKVTTATTPTGIAAARRKGLPPPGSNQYAYNAGAAILNINPAIGTFLQADRPAKSRGLAENAARMLGPFGEQERAKPKIGRKGKTR